MESQNKIKVKNAVIMAAGMSSRFVPLSYEYPKALITVRGEILIERQILQLKEAGIEDIIIVVGYKKECFYYLKDKFQVKIVENPEYRRRNNNSSLYCVKELLSNSYICSADNYFTKNVFESYVNYPYYAAVYQNGETDEWCITTDDEGIITDLKVGGENSWIMLGHAFFSEDFSKKFVQLLEMIYDDPNTLDLLWEGIYLKYIHLLKMHIRHYSKDTIFEFDTLDELREFDDIYYNNAGSKILNIICGEINCEEKDMTEFKPITKNSIVTGFEFRVNKEKFEYDYELKKLRKRRE